MSTLLELVEALIRQTTKEKFILVGAIYKEEGPTYHFGNVVERGHELADLHRAVANLIDEKVEAGLIIPHEIPRVS